MLSITAVPQDHLYQRAEKPSNLPKLKSKLVISSPRTKIENQKFLSDLNHEVIQKNLQATKHSNHTQIQTTAFMKQCEPKVNQLAKKAENSKKSIVKIDRKLNEIESEDLNKLQQLCKNIETKNSFILPKAQNEFNEMNHLIQQHKQYIEWYISKYDTKHSDITKQISELSEQANHNGIDLTSFVENAKGKIKLINPKIKAMDTHSSEIERKLQEFLQMYQKMVEMMKEYKNANKQLKYLETDGVNEMVDESYQTLIEKINEVSMEIEKDIHKAEMQNTEVETQNQIDKSAMEQDIQKLDQIAKDCQDNDVKIVSFKQAIKDRISQLVNKLQESMDDIKEIIAQERHDSKYIEWKSSLHAGRDVQYAMKVAKVRTEELQGDWDEFSGNNTKLQNEINDYIDSMEQRFGSSDDISYRIQRATAKLEWCQKRIIQWQRSEQYKHQSTESLKDIEESEKKLMELEKLLKKNDPQFKQPNKPYVSTPYKSEKLPKSVKSMSDDEDDDKISMKMPEYRLTYTSDELMKELPEVERDHYEEEEFDEDDDQSAYVFPDKKVQKSPPKNKIIERIRDIPVNETESEDEEDNNEDTKSQKSTKSRKKIIRSEDDDEDVSIKKLTKPQKPLKGKNESEKVQKSKPKKVDDDNDEEEPQNEDEKTNDTDDDEPKKAGNLIQNVISDSLEKKENDGKKKKKKVSSSKNNKPKEEIVEKTKTADGKVRVKKKVSKKK